MKKIEYTLGELEKDLKRLDKKAELLESLNLSSDEQEKIVAPVYLAKRVELFMRYFECKIPIKVEEK